MESNEDLKSRVIERLGSNDPLLLAILKWIEPEALWMACEEVGMVKGGTGTIVRTSDVTNEMLEVIRKKWISQEQKS